MPVFGFTTQFPSNRDGGLRRCVSSYVALNRRYKPVGLTSLDWVEYEQFPVRFKFKRALSAQQIAALSCHGDTAAERIYLYADGSVPTASAANWAVYASRLERLAGYKILHGGED